MSAVTLAGRLASRYPDDEWDGPHRLDVATAEAFGLRPPTEPRPSTEDIVDDVSDMLGSGVSLDEVCRQLGQSPHGLARRLYRAQHPDLARLFGALSARIYYSRGTKR